MSQNPQQAVVAKCICYVTHFIAATNKHTDQLFAGPTRPKF